MTNTNTNTNGVSGKTLPRKKSIAPKATIVKVAKVKAAKVARVIPEGAAVISGKMKTPPRKRTVKIKVEKASTRITGTLVYIATTSSNYWNKWVNEILNGADETKPRVARFVKDIDANGKIWGGYIATSPENVESVLSVMNAITDANNAIPNIEDQDVDLWQFLEVVITVEPTPRKRNITETTTEETTIAELV